MRNARRTGPIPVGWILAAVFLAHPAAAQEPTHPLEGARLRVTVWNTPLPALAVGTLTKVVGDTLVLTPAAGSELRVPKDRILQVERSVRPQQPNGGRIGFLIGAGAGTLILKAVFDAIYLNDEYNFVVGAMYGVPLGGLIGGIVGSERAQEKWKPVRFERGTRRPEARP